MGYCGGKKRTGKYISNAIKEFMKDKDHRDTYYEPFCGMLGVATHMDYKNCYCSDTNDDLIYFLEYIKEHKTFEKPIITKEKFDKLKLETNHSFERSFAMLFCTYLCVYSGSFYPEPYICKQGKTRYIHSENYNSIKRNIIPYIDKFQFSCCDYETLDFSNGGNIIYCDPPYCGTYNAYKSKKFDSEKFWKTVKLWSSQGNYVFVSELSCPLEHEIVYEKNLPVYLSNLNKKRMIDRLYFIKNNISSDK